MSKKYRGYTANRKKTGSLVIAGQESYNIEFRISNGYESFSRKPIFEALFTVQSAQPYTHCRLCGQKIEQFYGHDREVLLRHLPILGKPTFLCIFPARYRCLSCAGESTTTQQLEWYSPRSRYSAFQLRE